MLSSAVPTFSGPDDYAAAIRKPAGVYPDAREKFHSQRRQWPEAVPALSAPAGSAAILALGLPISGERQPVVDDELFLVVDSFERDPQGEAVLAARWTVRDARRDTVATRSQAIYRQPVAAASNSDAAAAAEVAALNRDLDRLTADLAASLRQLPG